MTRCTKRKRSTTTGTLQDGSAQIRKKLSGMTTTQKRELLMEHRKEQLRRLIDAYYQERGWNSCGIPMPETLKQLGLWEFLNDDARSVLTSLTS